MLIAYDSQGMYVSFNSLLTMNECAQIQPVSEKVNLKSQFKQKQNNIRVLLYSQQVFPCHQLVEEH